MWHKLDKINLEFMQVYNATLLTAINEKVSDFRCTEYVSGLICSNCPFNFVGKSCTMNLDKDELTDHRQFIASATKMSLDDWRKWFYDVTGVHDNRTVDNLLSKVPLFYYDKERVHGEKETNDLPEFNFENCKTSDKYPEIDLAEFKKTEDNLLVEEMNKKESENDMNNVNDENEQIINKDPVTENKDKDAATEHDFRQFIKYNVELILGEDREKYEYVTLDKMLEIVNTFMITYKSWMTKFTFNDLDDLDYRNTRLGCRVLNASTGTQLMNIYTNESNFGLKRKFVFKD